MQSKCVFNLRDMTTCALKLQKKPTEALEKCWNESFDKNTVYQFEQLEKKISKCFELVQE
jgi:hypothetical protein